MKSLLKFGRGGLINSHIDRSDAPLYNPIIGITHISASSLWFLNGQNNEIRHLR